VRGREAAGTSSRPKGAFELRTEERAPEAASRIPREEVRHVSCERSFRAGIANIFTFLCEIERGIPIKAGGIEPAAGHIARRSPSSRRKDPICEADA